MDAKSWSIPGLLLLSPSLCHAYSNGDSFLYLGKTGYAHRSHADAEDLDYSKDFSIEAVLYIPPHTSTDRWGGIFTKRGISGLHSAGAPGFGLGIFGGDSKGFTERIRAKVGDGAHHWTIDSPAANGVVHVVVTWDRDNQKLTMYLKGDKTIQSVQPDPEDPDPPTIVPENIANEDPFKIGHSSRPLQREVIYVRLWNRLIFAGEAITLWDHYNDTKKHTLPAGFNEDNLHSEWLMDKTSDAAGNTGVTHIYDSAGVKHLQLISGASVLKGTGTLQLVSPEPLPEDPDSDTPPPADTSVTLIAKGGAENLGAFTPPLLYRFEIAEDAGFSMNIKESGWIAHFSEWKSILKPGTTYYWRVQSSR